MKYSEAINSALHEAMSIDENVINEDKRTDSNLSGNNPPKLL